VRTELSRFHQLPGALASRSPRIETDPGFAPAAVAVVCVPDPDAILLIRRADRPGDPWSGQMGLPGGRMAPDDADLHFTAIREAHEEVGVRLGPANLLGSLDDLTPRTIHLPRIMVRPFVFLLPSRPPLTPNHEVASVAWAEVSAFRAAGVFGEWDVRALGQQARFPGYRLPEGLVWGLTERILTPFLDLLRASGERELGAASGKREAGAPDRGL
jgi:8-oxo-dGTP pyrophosphatase MutT (NUDIX family)